MTPVWQDCCFTCIAHYMMLPDSTCVTACKPGYYYHAPQCQQCNAGFWSLGGMSPCQTCHDLGHSNAYVALRGCQSCGIRAQAEIDECVDCVAGNGWALLECTLVVGECGAEQVPTSPPGNPAVKTAHPGFICHRPARPAPPAPPEPTSCTPTVCRARMPPTAATMHRPCAPRARTGRAQHRIGRHASRALPSTPQPTRSPCTTRLGAMSSARRRPMCGPTHTRPMGAPHAPTSYFPLASTKIRLTARGQSHAPRNLPIRYMSPSHHHLVLFAPGNA